MMLRRIDQNRFPIQVLKIHCSSLCLIGNHGSESTAPAQSHLTCEPCQERWHLVDPSSHEGGLWLSLDLARCLKTEESWTGRTVGKNVSLWKPWINCVLKRGRHRALAAKWRPKWLKPGYNGVRSFDTFGLCISLKCSLSFKSVGRSWEKKCVLKQNMFTN